MQILAIKRHKKRPASQSGKMENYHVGENWSGKLDTQLYPPNRYVLQNDFPILFKQAEWPYGESGDVAGRYLKHITDEWQLFKDRVAGTCTRIHNLRAPLQMFLDLCDDKKSRFDLRLQADPHLKQVLTKLVQILNQMEDFVSPAEDKVIEVINKQLSPLMSDAIQLIPKTKRAPVPINLQRPTNAPAAVPAEA